MVRDTRLGPNRNDAYEKLAYADTTLDYHTDTQTRGDETTMNQPWWKTAVVYQIYCRSFMDSNGDGIGDLGGVHAKLDYLKELGVDVLWLSPIYESPDDDNGYDVSNYRDISPQYGTMNDFDVLLHDAHQRGLKIIMDLVVNHTSDEHPWFVQSRASRDNPFRDYYIWRDQPNDWKSAFGGSAWALDDQTGQYYLHLFSKKQPDLNWENPKVRGEVYDLMRFWLDKGVDGFRMDAINCISKSLKSSAADETTREYFHNGPRVHEFLQEMRAQVLSHYDIMTVGETANVTPKEAVLYTDPNRGELNMIFHFEHVHMDAGPNGKWDIKPWSLADLKEITTRWQEQLYSVGWNSLYLNNHDQARMVSRFGNDKTYRLESAKMLATFLYLLQGTPYMYQGEEIGMTNVAFVSIDDYKDVETRNMWDAEVVHGTWSPEQAMQAIWAKSRDNARTPMQWDASKHGGFTTGTPWIAVNPNYTEINVRQATSDPDSVFHYYRKLIQLRKQLTVITEGQYELIVGTHDEIYAYTRTTSQETLLVLLNFFGGRPTFSLPHHIASKFSRQPKLVLGNYQVNPDESLNACTLRPYEARVYLFSTSTESV